MNRAKAPHASIRKRSHTSRVKEAITPYLFLLPNITGFLIFTAFPVVFSIMMSFFHWPMVDKPSFVGLDNYVQLFTQDALFLESIIKYSLLCRFAITSQYYCVTALCTLAQFD